MFGWLRGKEPPARLPGLLAGYPPLAPLHLGRTIKCAEAGPLLTIDQCRANLDAYRAAMPDRLDALGTLLANFEIDTRLAYTDPVGFVRLLHPMMKSELPSVYRPEARDYERRDLSDRAGADIALSLMADLAMLEMDVLMRAKPGCFIGLNLDRGDQDMYSYRRPCLLGLMDSLFPGPPTIYHLEAEWFGIYANMDDPRRFALPDRVIPEAYGAVIGGPMLERLDRDIVDPKLDERMRTTWLGKSA